MTRPKSKAPAPAPAGSSSSTGQGYCHSCGRLLPREDKNDPTPRKYCSATCRSHSKSTYLRDIRTELIRTFHHLLESNSTSHFNVRKTGKGNQVGRIILCSEAEKAVFAPQTKDKAKDEVEDGGHGFEDSSCPGSADTSKEHEENKDEVNDNDSNDGLTSDRPSKTFMATSSNISPSEQREEARRAARRLVAFGFSSQGIPTENRAVEAVQNGKVVETSFAKGEWGIRWK
ncbi:uncharacterized protein I303_106561 [Kwoniella dejecticola CBS 10117]|uniref:Uncharacterized protein n=1 Tax=Kwoniella dejecticola CBS 10117 TaxID=1296121 RepID=A0AAJ8KUR3_9TREE